MLKRMLIGLYFAFALCSATVFAEQGDLFQVTTGGTALAQPVNFTLCLNVKGPTPLSCQNYMTQQVSIVIRTTIPNHSYTTAGIRVNTPGYRFTRTTFRASKLAEIAGFTSLGELSSTQSARGAITVTNKQSQTITFTSIAPSATVGGATYTPTASSTSGLTVTIAVAGSSSSVCTMSGGVVSFIGAGTCKLIATQSGDENYNPALPVQQDVTVGKRSQTITFTSIAPSATVGGATYTPTASSTSGLTVTIAVAGSSSSVCTMSGGVVLFIGAGTCKLIATQSGDENYNPALPVQQDVTVGKGSQTIVFTSAAPSATVGGATYAPTATSTSGLTVTIAVDGSSSSVCTMNGGVVSFIGIGTCKLTAIQGGDENYNPALPVQQDVTVTQPSPTTTVVYSSLNPSITGGAVTLSANVSSSVGTPTGTVSFTANAVAVSGCSAISLSSGVAACTTTMLAVGANSIVATYSGGGSFAASESPAFTQQVIASAQVTTVSSAPIYVRTIPGNATVTLSWIPPSNTGGAVITGYTVTYGPTAGNVFNTAGCTTTNGLSCVVSALTNGTPYTFKVTASNSVGNGLTAFSSSVTPTAGDLSVSTATLALSGLGGGASRSVTLKNISGNPLTITAIGAPTPSLPGNASVVASYQTSCATDTVLDVGASCTMTINPGSMATSSSGCATTPATLPTASTITLTYDGGTQPSVTTNVVIVGYACQYQGGYLYSINDQTPISGSISGAVVTVADQRMPPPGGIVWSTDFVSLWGIAETSTISSPVPDASSTYPATLGIGQLNCNGNTDGACNTNNIYAYYSATPLTAYAVGFCKQEIDSNGVTPCTTGACYTDWYLPSICEMGYDNNSEMSSCGAIPGLIQNMQVNLVDNNSFNLLFSTYWSSSENSGNPELGVWMQDFTPGGGNQDDVGKGEELGVRCSRILTL